MTIEEKAIEQLEKISEHLSAIGEKEDYTDIAINALRHQQDEEGFIKHKQEVLERIATREAEIDKYIKELEKCKQQLSEDCISREAVNALVDELARAISDERCCISRGRSTATIMRDILHLPSVTLERPKGNWIKMPLIEAGQTYSHKCSLCGRRILVTDAGLSEFPYCHCGAEMSGGKEGEASD